jgi:N-terminal half of MaoC dehydratase
VLPVPDPSHVGRRYSAPGQVVDPQRARVFAQAIAGDGGTAEPDTVPPTFAAVYCMAPTLAQVFTDPEVGINLAGLIHGEQRFEWPSPVRPGDMVDASAEIIGVEQKRGMTFVSIAVEALRPSDGAVVCRGRSLMIVRGGAA